MKNFWHIFRERAIKIWKWLVRRDIPTYLLFVAMATLVWWGRAMSSPREADLSVQMVYTQVSDRVVFDTPLPETLRLTIRDTGKRLRQISTSKPELSIDMTPYLSEEEGVVHISAEVLRPRLQDILPGSTLVLQVQPEVIDVPYHKEDAKVADVRLVGSWQLAQQYQMSGNPALEPQQVTIYGKQSALKRIREIKTEHFQLEGIRDTVRYEAVLDVPSDVRIVPSTVMVTFVTEQFTEKSFIIPITTVGNEEEKSSLRLFPHEVTLQARVGMSHYADVCAEDFVVRCQYPQVGQEVIPVEVICTNPYVTQWRVTPSEVEYIIKQ